MFIGRIDLLKSLTKQSNLFLPFGKVRMGYPLGRSGWVIPLGRSGWVILWEGQDGLSLGKVRMGYPLGRSGWVILGEGLYGLNLIFVFSTILFTFAFR